MKDYPFKLKRQNEENYQILKRNVNFYVFQYRDKYEIVIKIPEFSLNEINIEVKNKILYVNCENENNLFIKKLDLKIPFNKNVKKDIFAFLSNGILKIYLFFKGE